MIKELYERLSQNDKIEYMLSIHSKESNYDSGFIVGLYAWIGAGILFLMKSYTTAIQLLVYGVCIPMVYILLVMILNASNTYKVEKDFVARALKCKQKS